MNEQFNEYFNEFSIFKTPSVFARWFLIASRWLTCQLLGSLARAHSKYWAKAYPMGYQTHPTHIVSHTHIHSPNSRTVTHTHTYTHPTHILSHRYIHSPNSHTVKHTHTLTQLTYCHTHIHKHTLTQCTYM